VYLRESWENNAWVNDLKKLWTYDENDNCTGVENFSYTVGSWHPVDIPMYLYYNNMQSSSYYYAYKVTAIYNNVSNPTSTEDFAHAIMKIFPNPTSGQLYISNEERNIQQITIYDFSGVKMLESKYTTLDISHFPSGIYFVQIITEKGVVTKKIVKM
jgi:hypothetical protein